MPSFASAEHIDQLFGFSEGKDVNAPAGGGKTILSEIQVVLITQRGGNPALLVESTSTVLQLLEGDLGASTILGELASAQSHKDVIKILRKKIEQLKILQGKDGTTVTKKVIEGLEKKLEAFEALVEGKEGPTELAKLERERAEVETKLAQAHESKNSTEKTNSRY